MKSSLLALAAVLLGTLCSHPTPARAATASEIDHQVEVGLQQLFESSPETRSLAKKAKAILVFPKVFKGGFMFAGKYGQGALVEDGYVIGYYSTTGASYGFQAGITEFGYAMFFMDRDSLAYFKKSKGWELGVGPTVVVADASFAKELTSTTLRKGVYAFFFNQKGLMAGAGLQGAKITRIFPE